MRITGGTFGGRALAPPQDMNIRPTSDKVRQAIFNILEHHHFGAFSLERARVVDLFAGTGAMGIEALSRGAAYCLFVDDSAESRALVRTNVDALQLMGVTKIWRRDARNLGPLPQGAGGPFDLAFLDPPYRKNMIAPALAALVGGWLSANAVVVAEYARDEAVEIPDRFAMADAREYGDTRAVFLLPK